MPGSSLLKDIKIVDMTSILFGPYCTQTLSDMGADVVKIEPEAGDILRLIGSSKKSEKMGPLHLLVNRGKRSVTWNLKSEQGKEATRRLIERSDIFIHNIRQEAAERLGLTFEDVKKINKKIIYVHCQGFSADGPYAGRPAYDDLIQGLSGMTTLSSRVDQSGIPRFIPMALADKVSGLHAVQATLAAIIERDRTNKAVHVEVPMQECVTSFVLTDHIADGIFDPPGEMGYDRQLDPGRQPLKTKDGYIILAPYHDDRWLRTFKILDVEHLLDDDRLRQWSTRRKHFSLMQKLIEPYIEQETSAHWIDVFNKNDIPVCPAYELEDILTDAHLQATNFFQKKEHPSEGSYIEMQPPIRFKGSPSKPIRPAPTLGEHTEEVLEELGL